MKAEQQDERIMELFRNRAELKKAHVELRDEIGSLKDRLKQQEGATARVQELLRELEQRLASRDAGYACMVFYQLRALWQFGHALIAKQQQELERKYVEVEHKAFVAEVNRVQFARRKETTAALERAQLEAVAARQQLDAATCRLTELNRPWHHFKRREAEVAVARAKTAVVAADERLAAAREAQRHVENAAAGSFPGLSVAARREINLRLIAYAESLCMRLEHGGIAAQARAAATQRQPSDSYQGKDGCERTMNEIERSRSLLEQNSSVDKQIPGRVRMLAANARYRTEQDTIPLAESIAMFKADSPRKKPAGVSPARLPNVLTEDTWDLLRALLQ